MKPLEIGPETCSNVEFDNAALISFNILVKANNFRVLWGAIEAVAWQSSQEFSRLIEQIRRKSSSSKLVMKRRLGAEPAGFSLLDSGGSSGLWNKLVKAVDRWWTIDGQWHNGSF